MASGIQAAKNGSRRFLRQNVRKITTQVSKLNGPSHTAQLDAVRTRLKTAPENSILNISKGLRKHGWTEEVRKTHVQAVLGNLAIAEQIGRHFSRANFGLPIGPSIPMSAVIQPNCVDFGATRYSFYYRNSVPIGLLQNMGYSMEDCFDIAAKSIYGYNNAIPNETGPFIGVDRVFWPLNTDLILPNSHVLGDAVAMSVAKLVGESDRGVKSKPIIQTSGAESFATTAGFKQGMTLAHSALISKGKPCPLIFHIGTNGRSITKRVSYEEVKQSLTLFPWMTVIETADNSILSLLEAKDLAFKTTATTGRPVVILQRISDERVGPHACEPEFRSDKQKLQRDFDNLIQILAEENILLPSKNIYSKDQLLSLLSGYEDYATEAFLRAQHGDKPITRAMQYEWSNPGLKPGPEGTLKHVTFDQMVNPKTGVGESMPGRHLIAKNVESAISNYGGPFAVVSQEGGSSPWVRFEAEKFSSLIRDNILTTGVDEAEMVWRGVAQSLNGRLPFVFSPHLYFWAMAEQPLNAVRTMPWITGQHQKAGMINVSYGPDPNNSVGGHIHNSVDAGRFIRENTVMSVPYHPSHIRPIFDTFIEQALKFGRLCLMPIPTSLYASSFKINNREPAQLGINDIMFSLHPSDRDFPKTLFISYGPMVQVIAGLVDKENLPAAVVSLPFLTSHTPPKLLDYVERYGGEFEKIIFVDANHGILANYMAEMVSDLNPESECRLIQEPQTLVSGNVKSVQLSEDDIRKHLGLGESK